MRVPTTSACRSLTPTPTACRWPAGGRSPRHCWSAEAQAEHWSAIRRSTTGRDRTLLVRAGSAADGQTTDNKGRSGHQAFGETADRHAYSLLTSGGEAGDVEFESPHPTSPLDARASNHSASATIVGPAPPATLGTQALSDRRTGI